MRLSLVFTYSFEFNSTSFDPISCASVSLSISEVDLLGTVDDPLIPLLSAPQKTLQLQQDLEACYRLVTTLSAMGEKWPAKVIQVHDIPRTLNNKIVEIAVRNVIHNRPVENLDALANLEALEFFRDLPELKSN